MSHIFSPNRPKPQNENASGSDANSWLHHQVGPFHLVVAGTVVAIVVVALAVWVFRRPAWQQPTVKPLTQAEVWKLARECHGDIRKLPHNVQERVNKATEYNGAYILRRVYEAELRKR